MRAYKYMDRKKEGIEFNREAFAAAPAKEANAGPRLIIGLLLVVAVVALGLIAYKVLIQGSNGPSPSDAKVVAELDQRLSMIEDRLDQIEKEHGRKVAAPAPAAPAASPASASTQPEAPHYRISNPTPQQHSAPATAAPDPATSAKLAGIQQNVGSLQNDANANKEAWQATTDRLADVAGQIGTQHNAMIKSQEELNML